MPLKGDSILFINGHVDVSAQLFVAKCAYTGKINSAVSHWGSATLP